MKSAAEALTESVVSHDGCLVVASRSTRGMSRDLRERVARRTDSGYVIAGVDISRLQPDLK